MLMCKLGYIGGQPDDDDSGQYRGNPSIELRAIALSKFTAMAVSEVERDSVETRRQAPDLSG